MVQKLHKGRKAKPKQKEDKQEKNKLSKYIKKVPKDHQTKRDNTYVFEGFYAKLKSLDVKHSHGGQLDASFIYDRLLDQDELMKGEGGEDDALFKSNFIQMLRSEKANNKTVEFTQVYKDLEGYCFSYPLLIMNKAKVIDKLLGYLGNASTLKVLQTCALELFIALIKDFRQDIYIDFIERIMPTIISIIDIQNVQILDKVFTLLSFAVKYLTKPIKEDFERFYQSYFELLIHRNRFIRKFAAQSLCYVIRKLPFDNKLCTILFTPLLEEADSQMVMGDVFQTYEERLKVTSRTLEDMLLGTSEMIFEVIYGASEGLHSKAKEVLQQIVKFQRTKAAMINLIRQVYMKLSNEVDTEKQQAIYDSVVQNLGYKESEDDLNLLLVVFKDCIKLKFGRRFGKYGLISLMQVLNHILQKNLEKASKFSQITKLNIASTMSALFYFKHHALLQTFANSNQDFNSSKNIFTHGIFQLCSSIDILSAYCDLLMQPHSAVKSDTDLDLNKILGLKHSQRQQIEFSKDSHKQKLKVLIKAINKHVLKKIVEDQEPKENIAILMVLVHQLEERYLIEVSTDIEQALVKLVQKQQKNSIDAFIVYKFIAICKISNQGPLFQFIQKSQIKAKAQEHKLDLTKEIEYNFIIKNYLTSKDQLSSFETSLEGFLDLANLGDNNAIAHQICALQQAFIGRFSKQEHQKTLLTLLIANPSDIVTLRCFNQTDLSGLSVTNNSELFTKLSQNLQKNQRQLRLETLKAIAKFESLEYLVDPENKQSSSVSEKCEIPQLMMKFEELEVTLESEKGKLVQLQRIKAHLENGLVPEDYLELSYNFLIGSFWIKFTPLFTTIQETIQELIRLKPDVYGIKLLGLVHNMSLVTQLKHSNDEIMQILTKNRSLVQASDDLLTQSYLRESSLKEDFMEFKDFFYNLTKSLCIDTILSKNELKTQFFNHLYSFIDLEYNLLYFSKSKVYHSEVLDRMTYANMLDSEEYRAFRRQAYSKLYCYLELLSKADNLKKIPEKEKLQGLCMRLLNNSDTKLQKLALSNLIACDSDGVLRHYRKLLEGFTDDQKFKDMIQVLIFGQKSDSDNPTYKAEDENSSKKDKNAIPKLQDQHRPEVLPIVIRLLLSKLMKKKGAINKKTIHTRRYIIYNFMSQLNPDTELSLFFDELLSTFNLTIAEIDQMKEQALAAKVSQVSFSGYLNFINSLSVIIKQMGNVINQNKILDKVTKVFLQIMQLTKQFLGQLKLTLADEAGKEEEPKFEEQTNELGTKDTLYRFVGHQSKTCLRKSLSILKQLYSKYNLQSPFMQELSSEIYHKLVKDQLPLLNQRYISDKSQLLEILTTSWGASSSIYMKFPDVLPALLGMLSSDKITPEVYGCHIQLLKSMIMKSIDGLEDKKDLAFLYKGRRLNQHQDEDIDSEEQEQAEAITKEEREQAQLVLATFIQDIAGNLNTFCSHNLNDLKKTLTSRGKKPKAVMGAKPQAHETKNYAIKDLIFIMSEVANYLKKGDEMNMGFLEMIVSVLSLKPLHHDSNPYFEDLLHFGCKSICNLIVKLDSVPSELLDKIYQLFLSLKALRVRQALAHGLNEALQKVKSDHRLEIYLLVSNLNTLKRGLADLDFDYDLIISTIQRLVDPSTPLLATLPLSSMLLLTYPILFLLQNEEFSVRDYAKHYLTEVLTLLTSREDFSQEDKQLQNKLIGIVAQTIWGYVVRPQDEMVLKTVLETLRVLIPHVAQAQPSNPLVSLLPLVNLKDDNEDFFILFLSIKLKSRQRALKMLCSKLELLKHDLRGFQQYIMPLVNYVVFGAVTQKKQQRNTISYKSDEKRQLLEEGLNVYQALASHLRWSDYYKLIKTLTYRLQKLSKKQTQLQHTGDSDDLKDQERVLTKCLCRILNAFPFTEVPDAATLMLENAPATDTLEGREYDQVMEEVMGQYEDESEDSEQEELLLESEQQPMLLQESQNQVADIQNKLQTKLLPLLDRHLFEPVTQEQDAKGQQPIMLVRSFVVLAIVKTLRHLPVQAFQYGLGKLLSSVVSKGLRSRDIGSREKSRKSLIKVIEELQPRLFLPLLIQELKDQLTKGGYQLHTFVFTVYYLLQQLSDKKVLRAGDVTPQVIEMVSEKLMEELLNVQGDQQLEDQERVRTKESKTKRAIPTFELMSQYISFKHSFFPLIAPILHSLDSNPTISNIQQCEDLLNRLSSSLLKNSTLEAQEMLMFMYTVIQRGIDRALKVKVNDFEGKHTLETTGRGRDYGAKPQDIFLKTKEEYKEATYKVEMTWKKAHQQLTDKKTQEISGRVLGSFGMMCLKKALKNQGLIFTSTSAAAATGDNQETMQLSEELKAKLDPFVPLLLDAFKTYHNPLIVSALHILGQLLPLNLPTFKTLMRKFLNRIMKLFDTSSSAADADFLNSLFKCTSELLKTYGTFQDLTPTQLKQLLKLIKLHLNTHSIQNNVLQCLRAIVYRKFVASEVYDLIEVLQDMMITNISKPTRSICSLIFTTFLLNYPLEDSRLAQHLQHLLKNLGYFDTEGRLQGLEVLHGVVEKLPREVVDQYGELVCFTLVLRSVNEEQTKCREKVIAVLKKLLQKVSPAKSKTIFNTLIQMSSPDPTKAKVIQQAKLSVLGLYMEISGKDGLNQKDMQKVLEQSLSVIEEQALVMLEEQAARDKQRENQESEESEEEEQEENPETKKFLKSIELMDEEPATKVQEGTMGIDFEQEKDREEWSPLYYTLRIQEKALEQDKSKQQVLGLSGLVQHLMILAIRHKVYWIRLSVQKVLSLIFEASGQNIKKCLSLNNEKDLVNMLHHQVGIFKFRPMAAELSNLLQKNVLFLLRNCLVDPKYKEHLKIDKVFSKVSFIARKMMLNITQAKERIETILQFFFKAITLFEEITGAKDNEYTRATCEPILELVYRIYTDTQYQNSSAKELSFDIVDYYSQHLDKSFFIALYTQVKSNIHSKRLERKRLHKVKLATPEGAKIKERKRERKVLKKKEKKKEKKLHYELRKN